MTPTIADVEAELAVTHRGVTFDVWTESDALVVNAPSLWSVRHLQGLPESLPPWLPDPAAVASGQRRVELRVRHATVATVGEDGPAVVRRAAGVDARPDWRGLLAAAVRALG